MRRSVTTGMAATGIALAAVVATTSPATAAPADKPRVLSSWTQTSQSSYNAWASANANRGAWSAYGFDWSTNYCTASPDNPFGFPFSASCARHDFGYRNYKAQGTFSANKNRLDSAFHEDMKRVCARYTGATKSSCTATAWTYYQAVRLLG
ncbi:phospholipase [Streptomyces sparsus]